MEAEADSEEKQNWLGRFKVIAILSVAVIAGLIFLGRALEIIPSSITLPCKPDNQTVQECPSDNFPKYAVTAPLAYIDSHNGLFQALAAIASAGFAGILYSITKKQAGISARQTHIAEQQTEIARSQSRAFVFVESLIPVPEIAGALTQQAIGWRVDIRIQNSGATQTKHLQVSVNSIVRDSDLPDDFDFPDDPNDPTPRLIIGPKQSIQINGPAFNVVDLARTTFTTRIFFWGWIDYNDIFEGTERHRTEFCLQVHAAFGDLTNPDKPAIYCTTWKRHNGTEGECMKKPRPYNPEQ